MVPPDVADVAAIAVPSYDIVTAELGEKSLPVTVTVEPALPLVGLSAKDVVDAATCGIKLSISGKVGIERIAIRRTERNLSLRLDLLICRLKTHLIKMWVDF